MNNDIPNREGFFWAKWKVAKDRTDACHNCGHNNSDFENSGIIGHEWEVVRVVHNGGVAGNPEEYLVEVPGVGRWQPQANFFWGKEVTRDGRP